MQKSIAAFWSSAVLCAGVMATPVLAQEAPVSRFSESSSTSSPSSAAAPAPATSAPTPSSYGGSAPGSASPAASGAVPSPTPQGNVAANVSDEKLRQFVASSQRVALISQEYEQKFNATADESSRQQIANEAHTKMVQAVESTGLSVPEFTGIGQAVESDPALRDRAQKFVN
jgi:hypothetical protein